MHSSLVTLKRGLGPRLAFGVLWLLFLPNAPYIVTDFLHLRDIDSGPLWLDVLLLASCAATGLALGFGSVLQIHRLFRAAGRSALGWLVALSGMLLSGLGIYPGRFLRWRSVDIIREPMVLLGDILERIGHPLVHYRAWGVTLGFGLTFAFAYVILVLRGEWVGAGNGRQSVPAIQSWIGRASGPFPGI